MSDGIKFVEGQEDVIDVMSEIQINYSYNKHPKRGYHCAFTEGLKKFGCPELVLMDYYPSEEASYILLSAADAFLNGDLYDPESEEYDFFGILELADEQGSIQYRFGFIGGFLYDDEVMCMQQLDEDDYPIHPNSELLPSFLKRGFEPWPLFMYAQDEEDEDEGEEESVEGEDEQ